MPQGETDERLNFYSEMIDDRMEEGLTEEEAVAAVGTVEEIAGDVPPADSGKKTVRRLAVWEIVLLILGAPLWLSLGLAAAAVVLAVYASLWAVVVSLWAVFVSLGASAAGLILFGGVFAIGRNGLAGVAAMAAGLVLAGLTIFAFFGCLAVTKGALFLTGKTTRWIKSCFARKEEVR